ncbi:alpha/beta hydrolase [Chenggangzhangella methanolivorans]|uniref:Alpha/beta hydrolase n=1 Tax=Chenggangzhangella methanolivorans TaxID=1437009 RepID=A0A9E6R8E0_9HYPH|nr:alpha/beta hydrolase [Chenggangzhangella methanolivorans]QZN98527.1 alpha/beta hydrolase [Chenggangzhangella methanolivorans]
MRGRLIAGWIAALAAAAVLAGARLVPVLVATTRKPDPVSPISFGADRSHELAFARYVVSVPPGHKPGDVESAGGDARADAAKSFAVVEARRIDEATFFREAAAASRGSRTGATGVFVHGYNYTFEESLFRRAQLSADSHVAGAAVLFAWPSAASPTGYVADRDASTMSRDGLARVLDGLAAERTGRVIVFSHSMGSNLVMESLRTLRLSGRGRTLDRLDQVVMAAPDIDVDLFVEQLEAVGRLKKPLVVMTSKDDGALSLSSALAGERRRVGNADVDDPRVQAGARKYDVSVIDISEAPNAGGLGHDRYAAMAAVYPKLRAQLGARSSLASKAGTFLFDMTQASISPATPARR